MGLSVKQEEYLREQRRWWDERETIDTPNEYEQLARVLLAKSICIEFQPPRPSGSRRCNVIVTTGEHLSIDSHKITLMLDILAVCSALHFPSPSLLSVGKFLHRGYFYDNGNMKTGWGTGKPYSEEPIYE